MTVTLNQVAWIALSLALIVAVGAVIIQPTYEKAKEQQEEIENIEWEEPTSYLPNGGKVEVALNVRNAGEDSVYSGMVHTV
ncbi:MAG: hypothetical protein QME73_14135 [Bacillota bacterium]|nr:hypothetical protein [Bacillota bacterium]NPV44834.1 hypothetical protein [Bacillota bacterium]